MSENIGLFYGSTTCYTEMAAEKIKAELDPLIAPAKVELFDIKDTPLSKISQYEKVILGISTWDFGELQEDWESSWDDVNDIDFTGKTVALYGLGDQYGYADWFQDALGMLHDLILPLGAEITGYWPNQGYEFTASKALTDDAEFFVGLSLDDENQFDVTDTRIRQWCASILDDLR